MERLGEIENHVGREAFQFFHDAHHVVENRQRVHFVPQALQARQHVGFGRLVLFFLQRLRREGTGSRGSAISDIEKHQDLHD